MYSSGFKVPGMLRTAAVRGVQLPPHTYRPGGRPNSASRQSARGGHGCCRPGGSGLFITTSRPELILAKPLHWPPSNQSGTSLDALTADIGTMRVRLRRVIAPPCAEDHYGPDFPSAQPTNGQSRIGKTAAGVDPGFARFANLPASRAIGGIY
jgi:hypothetical protein